MTAHPARPSAPALWRSLVRGGRLVLLATVACIALLGAVVTHWIGMLVVAPALGALLAAGAALVGSSRRGAFHAGAAGVVLVPLGNGLALLGSAGGAVLLALWFLAPLVAAGWASTLDDGPDAAEPGALRELLPLLPTAQLLEEWRASEDLLRSPSDRAAAAGIRALILDELAHRDPAGVADWLAAGGPAPGPYIRADRDLAG